MKSFAIVISIFFLSLSSCSKVETPAENTFFEAFANHKGYNSKYRVGVSSDSTICNFQIKAMTTAWFDSINYTSETIYILKHNNIDTSIVLSFANDPIITKKEFQDFYNSRKTNLHGDTIINSSYLNQFQIPSSGKIDVEFLGKYPFVFMDVDFDERPELLIKKEIGNHRHIFTVYEINDRGYSIKDNPPFNEFKSSVGSWCYGGSTEIDYDNQTINVTFLTSESCSDYGNIVNQTYKYNPSTKAFEIKQTDSRYDYSALP